jgi:branched-chain amino acid transport system substrate-binding protein
MLKQLFAFALALALLTASGRAATPDPYVIYAISPLTGPAAYFGQEMATALAVYEKVANRQGGINGRPVHFEVLDNQSQPQLAVQLYNGIVAKHVPVVLGPSNQQECNAIAPLASANGPIEYCFSPGFPGETGTYLFGAGAYITHSQHVMLKYIHDQGTKRLGVIVLTDATGINTEKLLTTTMAIPDLKGMEVVDLEHFDPGALTIDAQLARLKAARPEYLYVNSNGAAFQTVLRGMANAGMRIPVVTSSANMDLKVLSPFNDSLPAQVAFNAPPSWGLDVSEAGKFAKALLEYRNAYSAAGAIMTPNDNYAWDAAGLIVAGLRKVGTNATAAQLRDYILHVHGLVGIGGTYDFTTGNMHGISDDGVMVVEYDPAKQTFVAVSKPGGVPLKTGIRLGTVK